MPPKKNDKKKNGKGEAKEVEGGNPVVLWNNYRRMCKNLGVPENSKLGALLLDEEAPPVSSLILDPEFGPLGPGGTRALATAILGSGPGMSGGPYKLLNTLRIWRCAVGDDGTACLAELLRLGGDDVKISFMELMDNHIGVHGCAALGEALKAGANQHLLTLRLDCNHSLGSTGVAALCAGLRTNSTLKQLHLPYCHVGPEGGFPLTEVLAFSGSVLNTLNLQGNQLGNDGLASLSIGLRRNKTITDLNLSDNGIDNCEEPLIKFRDALMANHSLVKVDLMFNRIGAEGGAILQTALGPENTTIKAFRVDDKLPMTTFTALHRKEVKEKKKKKGGKKKKKS